MLIELDDFVTLFQFVSGVVTGSGLTGLAVVYYEYRQREKERAKNYFRELVLTQDFFRYESLVWDLCNLYKIYEKVNGGETVLVPLQGSIVIIQNLDDWRRNTTELWLRHPMLAKKLDDTGVTFLAPRKIRVRLADISLAMSQFRKRIEAGEDISESAEKVQDQLKQLSEDVREIIGTLRL